ncbi:MAG: putative bifunctional diguanylate cyclase/phosphodiesterase [Solirubrobacteraceae bacterium]
MARLVGSKERQRAEAAIARLAAIVNSSDDAIIAKTLEGVITDWNPAAERMYGYRAQEAIGMPISTLLPSSDQQAELDEILTRVRRGERVEHLETTRRTKDGTILGVALTISPVRDHRGRMIGLSTAARDITDRKRHDQQLEYLADHDALTGLWNRRAFDRELTAHATLIDRYGLTGAVMVIDLDQFKLINDTLGHHAGDQLIIRTGQLLASRLRSSDVLARLGGDEFGVLLPRAGAREALQVAESLRQTLREAGVELGALARRITASIGIAAFANALSAEEVIVNADLAMYDAKEAGRDRVALFSSERSHQPRMKSRLAWVELIREALDQERFSLYAQPILELHTGQVRQYELLLRMLDETGDAIPPGSFIHIAERYDLIQEIDRWVIAEAIRLLEQHDADDRQLTFEVNISGKSLGDEQLTRLIEAELKRSAIDPASLIFEVTETVAVTNVQLACQFARRLASLGCRFALDDFGAGFGSFYYLKHIPFDFLKIDREFVTRCTTNRTDQLVIASFVAIAEGLHKQTIAEGVENHDTQLFLARNGVDYGQGHHIARPAPVAEALSQLSTARGAQWNESR